MTSLQISQSILVFSSGSGGTFLQELVSCVKFTVQCSEWRKFSADASGSAPSHWPRGEDRGRGVGGGGVWLAKNFLSLWFYVPSSKMKTNNCPSSPPPRVSHFASNSGSSLFSTSLLTGRCPPSPIHTGNPRPPNISQSQKLTVTHTYTHAHTPCVLTFSII